MIKSILFSGLLWLVVSNISAQVIKSAMINGCKTEGLNEYLIVKNANSSFTATGTNIDIRYGTSSPANTTITDQLLTNGDSAYIASLNAKLGSGCDFNFINATNSTTITANAYLMVMHKYPDDTVNFSAWCGKGIGNVFVVFADDASWGNSGIFANDTRSSTRYLRSTINNVTFDYNYGGINLSNDGGYVTWNDTAGTFSGSGTYTNCTPSNLQSLPVSLINFDSKIKNDITVLYWSTASEFNNDYFTIEAKNANTDNWEFVAQINGHINKQSISTYEYIIPKNLNKITYFRLLQTDIDGKSTLLGIIEVQTNQNKGLSFLGTNNRDIFITTDHQSSPIIIEFFNVSGSLILAKEINTTDYVITCELPITTTGLLIIRIRQNQEQIIQKYFYPF